MQHVVWGCQRQLILVCLVHATDVFVRLLLVGLLTVMFEDADTKNHVVGHIEPCQWNSIDILIELQQLNFPVLLSGTDLPSFMLVVGPVWAWGIPPSPYPFTSPSFPLSFTFHFFLFLFTSSVFLLVHPFPFYQNRPTVFPGW